MKENEILKNLVLKELETAVSKFVSESDKDKLKIRVEYSRNEKFGDYSTPFLMENKDLLGDPKANSDKFLNLFKDVKLFSKVDFTPPGFINFKIEDQFLLNYIDSFLTAANGPFAQVEEKEKIIFEFVSANPTGPLNIVSARAAATGDTICNLLSTLGHTVHREFYVNDYGNQVFLLGVSCLSRLRENLSGETLTIQEEGDTTPIQTLLEKNILPSEGYRGEYIKDVALKIYAESDKKSTIDSLLKSKEYEKLAEKFSVWAVEKNLEAQKEDLVSFGVNFDLYYSEKSLHEANKVLAVLEDLKKANDIKEEEGKQVFTSIKYGDDKDRVVVRDDGRPTYLLADIAYHKSKMDRGFTQIINIWGPDHHGYIARLRGAMISLGFAESRFKVLIAQQVNLISKGEKLKMSKRLGQFQTMKDLLEFLGESSKDVGRYFFVMRSLESPLDFDLDLAKEESDKNPVFYIQYAHARIHSIFRETGNEYSFEKLKSISLTEERRSLLFWVSRFPEEILDAAKNREPHRVTNYLQNLSKAFTRFYGAKDNRLKDCDESTRLGLAYICQASAKAIKEGLSILGISSPEKMERSA
ncbi:MAG TPA: arginine--tRNA ligase [Leptospiraceae bacterium]|nr:arginine--tRNA ligase [Leptospiraceae bacterium]HMW07665.1 arginine--tRNA ligase [Leptospiraceae bacterium]HMX33799.1 arginine--tRNA ligase [Leptospiraceae bacterium]HMY33321.1 arginine--tRNA ligase [Leptospiraceae bacterium]HMZ63058.1 arginine--tRNA ligase [Leptospiraceae bacterium]